MNQDNNEKLKQSKKKVNINVGLKKQNNVKVAKNKRK